MENLSKYYTLLKDPTRRKIIEILGTQEKIGFKELRETLGLGVGTVYYHLDMLSDFIAQDKQRKYRLNDRGRTLYRILKEGSIPATLEITEAFSHRLGRWLFLSPVFAKTANSLRFLPFSIAILLIGAYGSAYAELDPALFFYFSYSIRSFITIVLLFIFNWLGLFLFSELFAYLLYKRAGNELQLFACIGIAAIPMAVYPYMYLAIPAVFPSLGTMELNTIMQGILTVLQIWSLLLVSAALCFGKGLRLDKAIVISLTAVYLNMAALFLLGRFV
jgi:DNA-binding transcriptional ArsR family regulator